MDTEKEEAAECSQSTELPSMAATPNQPRLKKKVIIDDEPQSHDQASLVLKDSPADPKPKRPVLDEPVIVLLGREVLFAIGVFFLLALVVSLVVIQLTTITKLRTTSSSEESCKSDVQERKSAEERLRIDLGKAEGNLMHYQTRNKALTVRLNRMRCSKPDCLRAAIDLLDKMDYSVRPCEDFWRYSCGDWLDRTEIPESRDAWGPDSEAERQFVQRVINDLKSQTPRRETSTAERKYKALFQICMGEKTRRGDATSADGDDDVDDDEAYVPIRSILSGWTTCLDATPRNSTRVRRTVSVSSSALDAADCRRKRQKVLEDLLFSYAIDTFVSLTVVRNNESSPRINIIKKIQCCLGKVISCGLINDDKIDEGGLTLPDRNHYLNRNSQHSISSYRKHISDTMKRIWKKETSNTAIQEFAKSVINVEKQIAQLQEMTDDTGETGRDDRDQRNLGSILTVGKLQEISPEIDYLSLVQGLLSRASNETEVVVTSEEYMSNISRLLLNITESDFHNYFTWRLVFSLTPFVSTTMRNEQMAFINALKGKSSKQVNGLSPQRYCQDIVTEGFPHAVVSSVVFREDNMDNILSNVTDMVVNIKEALLHSVQKADWMDNETSTEAQAKLDDMKIAVAFPEFVLNETEVDRYYSSYVVNESQSYFENILNGLRHKMEMMRLRLDYPGDIYDEDWEVNPLQPKVFYSPDVNTIGISASLLQKPFYDQNRYVYVNYGSLGTMIAHEMMSVLLDIENRGLVAEWWSDATSFNFINRTQCVRDNYGQRHADFPGIGKLTFGEHFSDISGLMLSYQAYKRWEEQNGEESLLPGLNLSNDQVFFVAFAQNLCKVRRNRIDKRKRFVMTDRSPAEEFRVRESLLLSEDFRKVFKCEISTAKNATPGPPCDRVPW